MSFFERQDVPLAGNGDIGADFKHSDDIPCDISIDGTLGGKGEGQAQVGNCGYGERSHDQCQRQASSVVLPRKQ